VAGVGIVSGKVGALSGAKENELELVTVVAPRLAELFESTAGIGIESHPGVEGEKLHSSALRIALRKIEGMLMAVSERLPGGVAASEDRCCTS
jgi:hypothetical protein